MLAPMNIREGIPMILKKSVFKYSEKLLPGFNIKSQTGAGIIAKRAVPISATAKLSSRTIDTLSSFIAFPCFEATSTNVLPNKDRSTEIKFQLIRRILETMFMSSISVICFKLNVFSSSCVIVSKSFSYQRKFSQKYTFIKSLTETN